MMRKYLLAILVPLLLAGCFGGAGGSSPRIDDDLTPDISGSKADVQRYMRMGDRALDEGQPSTALMMYSAANKADPGDPAPLLASARLLEAGGDFNAAARLYDDLATRRDADDKLTLQLAAARSYLKAKNYPEAALRYDKLANQTGNWRAYNGLGVVRDLEGNQAIAIRSYQTALEKAPAGDKAKVRANLALSHILEGSPKQAIELLEPLDKAGTLSSAERRYLALAYGFSGRADDASRLGLDEPPTMDMLKQSLETMEGPGIKAAPAKTVTKEPVK